MDDDIIIIEDPPSPDLVTLEQRTEIDPMPAVPVRVEGPIMVQSQPARLGTITVEYLSTSPTQVLTAELKRSFAYLVAEVEWFIASKQNGLWARIPADVPYQCTHGSEVWAKVGSGTEAELTVVTEIYAQ